MVGFWMMSCNKCTNWIILSILFTWLGGQALAQINTPLHIGVQNAITDEAGNVLRGDASTQGDLVLVLDASSGVIPPDPITGQSDPLNPVVPSGVTDIGNELAPHQTESGLFGLTLSRSQLVEGLNNQDVFVRVYNGPTPEDSSFYADSQVFHVPASGNKVFWVDLTKTDKPLNDADDDGDGLNASWEKSLGTDASKVDTDGDGMTDGVEFAAGSDGTDASRFLHITDLYKTPAGEWHIQWDSALHVPYRIQFAANPLDDPATFDEIGSVEIGDGATTDRALPAGYTPSEYPTACYRVYVVKETP